MVHGARYSLHMTETLRLFIPLALGLSAVLFVSYVNDQQLLRGSANVIPEQLAPDLARNLSDASYAYVANEKIPIESSIAPYVVVYDSFGKPVSGTGYLDGVLPSIPPGIFDVARSVGKDTLSWQPEAGVRSSIVVVPVNGGAGGYVMAGQSLRYVEREVWLLGIRSALGWLAVMFAALIGSFVVAYLKKRK